MVINAVYENQTFTVKFCNEKGSTVSEQKVEYGHTATPPSSLEVAGKEFLGWSTDKEWMECNRKYYSKANLSLCRNNKCTIL